MPLNITAACDKIKGATLMPTTGLNVFSMLKHNTLVITLKSLEKIEERLLHQMHNTQFRSLNPKRN
jgi:large subunit ribosomal protein L4